MRRLLVLAPLLLTGCSLLMPDRSTYRTEWFIHDGYTLTCEDIAQEDCVSLADQGAALHRMGSSEPIMSITIGADGNGTICSASGCAELRTD